MSAELKCKNCKNRHPNCHSECESYLAWKQENEIKKEKIRKNKWIQNLGIPAKKKR